MESDDSPAVYMFITSIGDGQVTTTLLLESGELVGSQISPDSGAPGPGLSASLNSKICERFPGGFNLIFISNPDEAIGFASAIRHYYEIQNNPHDNPQSSDSLG